MSKARTVKLSTKDGNTVRVELFDEFDHAISGQKFTFLITREVSGMSKCITHKKSGLRVCALGVGASYLPAYAHLSDDRARARVALDELCELKGAARVRSVIAAAE